MRLVSPGSLAGAEKLVFENLRPWLPPQGVCVNVMLGQDPWDLRPLILENNKVSLLRFSRPLGSAALSALAAEMQGFSVIPGWEMKVEIREQTERLLLTRPVFGATLQEQLTKGEISSTTERRALISRLLDVVQTLRRRSLIHGHISPSNIVLHGEQLVLLDPRLGALHLTKDQYLAPEISTSGELLESSDLYSLGRIISTLLGPELSGTQREVVDRLLLPSPRQRPLLEEVEREFRTAPSSSSASSASRSGKLLKKAGDSKPPPPIEPSIPENVDTTAGASRGWLPWIGTGVAGLLLAGTVLKYKAPRIFNDLFRNIPLLVDHHNQSYELAWASNDKARMRLVTKSALIDHDPAAEAAITQDALRGEKREGVLGNLLRVVLGGPWSDQLSPTDVRAAIALATNSLYPEGLSTLPEVSALHPGVLLAIAGQSQGRPPGKQLATISIDQLCSLPDPVGRTFAQLKSTGSKVLGDPEVMSIASIISGNPLPASLEAYIGSDLPLATTLARLSIVLPLLENDPQAASLLLATLRDKGGEIGQTLSWFDIDTLGIWNKADSAHKLRLLLGELPTRDLDIQYYADLMTFPLEEVRSKSARVLKDRFLKGESDQLFLVLSRDQNRFSREQSVALLSALNLPAEKRAPYVALLLQLNPSPDMALLVLLARSNVDSSDICNLEIARYLRKTEWKATTEMLQLLASHPEPLARSMAYARLSSRDPEQEKILRQRLSTESDPALLKSLTEKLGTQDQK